MSMVPRASYKRRPQSLSEQATELCARPDFAPAPRELAIASGASNPAMQAPFSAGALRRLPKAPVPAFTDKEQQLLRIGATLQRKTRRSQYMVLAGALAALVLLDGVAYGRMAGWWGPTQVIPARWVPAVFVPATLRVLGVGEPSDAQHPVSGDAHPSSPAVTAHMAPSPPATLTAPAHPVGHRAAHALTRTRHHY